MTFAEQLPPASSQPDPRAQDPADARIERVSWSRALPWSSHGFSTIALTYLVDRAPETRWGTSRPFELIILACWIAAIFTFSTPGDLGDISKYAWVFASYILLTGLLMPLFAATTRSSPPAFSRAEPSTATSLPNQV